MEQKDYQQRVLKTLRHYLDKLNAHREIELDLNKAGKAHHYNFPSAAWQDMQLTQQFKSRKNGLGEDFPSICLKIPTGGGKTFIATLAIDLIHSAYYKARAGLVLWIVPTNQIYRQTLANLKNQEHYYRQVLDKASGGRTLILEKTDKFTPQKLKNHLIVMLLMLPSANRLDKETLKLFQDSPGFEQFFPAEENIQEQIALLKKFPNLDYFGSVENWLGIVVKTSLGNTLRIIKPLIVIDEGHKAYSDKAFDTINSFNPSFILELSATPTKHSNILVSISGQELNREEMIKLDLNIFNRENSDWKITLLAAIERMKLLEGKAYKYQAQTGKYIRPICLIQVERTGKDQEDKKFIHANEVKNHLIRECSISPSQIAIKSSETDDIEDKDLLSQDCQIQYIITKQALQEGWDCPFAYVLVVLTNPQSMTGLTQLIGRVLRQPYAKKTQIRELDESYVFCFRRGSTKLLEAIKHGFEEEGLGDLAHKAKFIEPDKPTIIREVGYREDIQKFEGKIYLPHFVVKVRNGIRRISYEMDILGQIDWTRLKLDPLRGITLGSLSKEDWSERIGLSTDRYKVIETKGYESKQAVLNIDKVFITHQICDIVPNPWVAYNIVTRTLELFREGYTDERIATDLVQIVDELKKLLVDQRDELAETLFRQMLASNKLRFFLQAAEDCALPKSIAVKSNSKPLISDYGQPIQLDFFSYTPDESFNETEKAVALYLDKQQNLLGWFRNLTGDKSYSIQGWKKPKIHPDFAVLMRDIVDTNDYSKVFVLETKGLHLKGNEDTKYKQEIFDLCNDLTQASNWSELGQEFSQKKVKFQIIYEDEWQDKINKLFI